MLMIVECAALTPVRRSESKTHGCLVRWSVCFSLSQRVAVATEGEGRILFVPHLEVQVCVTVSE